MGFVRPLSELEDWLNAHAESWAPLADRDYSRLVRRWSSVFGPLIDADITAYTGSRAIFSLESRLPGEVILFSGVPGSWTRKHPGDFEPAAVVARRDSATLAANWRTNWN